MFPGRGNHPSGRTDLSWTIKEWVSSHFRIILSCDSNTGSKLAVYILGEDPVLRELALLLVL